MMNQQMYYKVRQERNSCDSSFVPPASPIMLRSSAYSPMRAIHTFGAHHCQHFQEILSVPGVYDSISLIYKQAEEASAVYSAR